MSSSKATCKEQCTKCKCIVQERELKSGGNNNKQQKSGSGCNVSNNNACVSKVPCVEAYRDLGECLQKAIMAASQTKKEDDCSY